MLLAGEEVVEADDVVPLRDQPVAQVRAEEAGAAGDEDSHE